MTFNLGSIDVDIPKEHHRFVLGKGAEVLKRIQDQTGAKISVPKADEKDGLIRVTGSKEAMDAAKVSFSNKKYGFRHSFFSVKLSKSQLNKVVNIVKLSKLKPGFIPLFEVVMTAMLMHSRKNSESSQLMSHHHQPIRTMLLSVVKRKLPSHVPPN